MKTERQQAEELLLSKFPLLPAKSNKEGMDLIIDAMIEFKNEWVDASEHLPPLDTRVIGYFPRGDEGGEKVSTAITYDGNTLRSDFPNSTSHCFKATYWRYFPKFISV